MPRKILRHVVLVLCLGALTAPAWAKQLVTSITLSRPATIATTKLAPGSYQMVFDPDTQRLQVKQGRHVVAQPAAKWVKTDYTIGQSGVIFDQRQIVEIQFEGQQGLVKLQK